MKVNDISPKNALYIYATIRKRIYYSIPDPKFGGISALFNKNCHHRPEIYDNIGDSSKYKQLLQKFFNKKR